MLYKCFSCGAVGFDPQCKVCVLPNPVATVPLDPEYYEEFEYKTRGVKDLFGKKKAKQELATKLDAVLGKYKEFEKPYFVNYVHLTQGEAGQALSSDEYTCLELFHTVLLQLGFSELADMPQLTHRLIQSTALRFQYGDFVRRTSGHIQDDLESTLRSWIEETGISFRTSLPMLIYYLWENDLLKGEIDYREDKPPLIGPVELSRLSKLCERLRYEILLVRFRLALEQFDPSRYVTMYALDAMSGYEFEDFLGTLLTTLGFEVEVTRRSADQGADLFAQKLGRRVVIQAKNYSDSVGNAAVQQALSAKAFFSCDDAMVVTNSRFTASARELADSTGVRLIGRDELQAYLDDYNRVLMERAADRRDVG